MSMVLSQVIGDEMRDRWKKMLHFVLLVKTKNGCRKSDNFFTIVFFFFPFNFFSVLPRYNSLSEVYRL